jgi:hypothetical protein
MILNIARIIHPMGDANKLLSSFLAIFKIIFSCHSYVFNFFVAFQLIVQKHLQGLFDQGQFDKDPNDFSLTISQ